jgi:hypothetical protein
VGSNYEKQAVELAERNEYDELVLKGLIDLGQMFIKRQDLLQAQTHLLHADKVARRFNLNQSELFFSEGQLSLAEGFPEEAADFFAQSVRAAFPHSVLMDSSKLNRDCMIWQNMIRNVDYESAMRSYQRVFLTYK